MAKSASAPAAKINLDSLFKEVEAISGKAQQGIDALQAEQAEIRAKAEERISQIEEQVQQLNGLYHSATGSYYVGTPKTGKAASTTKGTRRSRADLETLAAQVVGHLKQAGKDGVSGSVLKSKFGKLLPSVKGFLAEYAPTAKITSTGEKAAMVYMI